MKRIFATVKARFVATRYSTRSLAVTAKLFTIALAVLYWEDEPKHRQCKFRYDVVRRETREELRRCECRLEGWESEIVIADAQ